MKEIDEEKLYGLLRKFIEDYYKDLTDKVEEVNDEMNDFYNTAKILNKRMESIEKSISAHAIGVQNVYDEVEKIRKNLDMMKSLQDRTKEETLPIDEVELTLRIKSYPMDIMVNMNIETNFGKISYTYNYPSFNEGKLSESINNVYFKLLNELYDEHEKKGGKFMGDDGCREWFEKNGKTIINKEPCLSKRISV